MTDSDWSSAELPPGTELMSGMVCGTHAPSGRPTQIRAATDREYQLCFIRGIAQRYGADTIRSILDYLEQSK